MGDTRFDCPDCGNPKPCGYSKCRACTFGPDSLEGRVERAYLPGGGGLEEEERILADCARGKGAGRG